MFRNLLAISLLILFAFPLPAQIDPRDVTIVRDHWGVPHIYGHTDADATYGLAWANAEDNFHDMQLNFLMSRARQGEVEGKDGAIIDYAVQLLRVREQVADRYDTDVSPGFRKILEAYAQGCNDYAVHHPDEILAKDLFPLTPQDILVGYVMSLTLLEGVHFHFKSILDGKPGAPTPFSLRGSNGIALNSAKTADGATYLANNSHQPLDGPTSWYEAHIVSEEGLNCHGGLFPGGASIFAGANPDLAWMHTVNYPDLVDVYELEMHPEHKLQYKFDGEWKTLEVKKARMKVKMGPFKVPVRKKAWWSVYGPTLKGKDGGFYAIRFPALHTIRGAEQWHRMNKARNFTEFHDILTDIGLPSLNIIYADRRDTIFFITNGLYPHRKAGYDWLGLLPGNTSETLWTTFHPLEDIPQKVNPASGYLFNTNNTPFSCSAPADNPRRADYDTTLYNYPYENNRSMRLAELLAENEKVDWETFKRIKYDRHYPDSMYIFFLENCNRVFRLDEEEFPDIAEEIRMIREWDREGQADSETAALFLLVYRQLAEEAIESGEYVYRKSYPDARYAEAIRKSKKYLQKHFGSSKVQLGALQRLVRGDRDLPIGGLPDVISCMNSKPWKKGRRRAWLGDSYIQLIRYSEEGLHMEVMNTYGASNKPDSPHYDDQMEPFVRQETRETKLDKDWVMRHAERIYHPGDPPETAFDPKLN